MDKLTTQLSSADKFESREIFSLAFELFKSAERSEESFDRVARKNLAKQLIDLYYKSFETNYESMIYNFRKKYIENEARVEYNEEDNEQELIGLGYMYDYIQEYVPNEKTFDIFIETLKLHKLLYKPLDDKFRAEKEKGYKELQEQLAVAKLNKDIQNFKRVNDLIKAHSESTKSFGGNFRTEELDLKGVEFHVPTALEASLFMNKFLNPEKKMEYQNILNGKDLFSYIDYCVKICVDIIKYQPFSNGNKRTARALLNLMFKNRNIPPVFIGQRERKIYKDALLKAIQTGDYNDIIHIYYSKICDSIYELDIKPYLASKESKQLEEKIMVPKTIEIIDIPIKGAVKITEEKLESINDDDVKLYDIKRTK